MKPAWSYFTTQKQWEQYLKDLLKSNDIAVRKSVVLIYNRQTEPERMTGESSEDNGVGFTKHDAKEMSAIARKIIAGEELTRAEMAKSRNKMGKYWHQLMEISLEQQEQKKKAQERQALEQFAAEKEAKLSEGRKQFEQSLEIIRRCAEEGISCDYGICDECPVTQGLQMRLNLKEAEDNA